ncbi:MAG: glycerophosphodiester phosphodiesterase family protein [Pseudomonadota bacterium]
MTIVTGYPNLADTGRIIAHRGASLVAPENTLAAFRAAREQGLNWIEFDVSLLGDGTPVIHHDETVDRCTSATGSLADLAAPDLATVSAGVLHGGAFATEPIPTLDATLDLLENAGMYSNLEMKAHDQPRGRLAGIVSEALKTRDWAAKRIIVSSFNHDELGEFRELMPEVPVAGLWIGPDEGWRARLAELRAAALHVKYTHLSQSLLQEATSFGFDVRVYTVNDIGVMKPFRDIGLTSIITDDPPSFLEDPDWAAWAARS